MPLHPPRPGQASKVKAAVIGGVKTTGETLASVGSTIKKGSIKLASKAGSAFKGTCH